jgi:hypothetical protein
LVRNYVLFIYFQLHKADLPNHDLKWSLRGYKESKKYINRDTTATLDDYAEYVTTPCSSLHAQVVQETALALSNNGEAASILKLFLSQKHVSLPSHKASR